MKGVHTFQNMVSDMNLGKKKKKNRPISSCTLYIRVWLIDYLSLLYWHKRTIDVVNMFTNMDANTHVQNYDEVCEHEYEIVYFSLHVHEHSCLFIISDQWIMLSPHQPNCTWNARINIAKRQRQSHNILTIISDHIWKEICQLKLFKDIGHSLLALISKNVSPT